MPPSKKALRNNEKKLNKKLGIGDKDGKVLRQKEVTAMISCTICGTSVKPTKTNSEIKAHAGKEGKSFFHYESHYESHYIWPIYITFLNTYSVYSVYQKRVATYIY